MYRHVDWQRSGAARAVRTRPGGHDHRRWRAARCRMARRGRRRGLQRTIGDAATLHAQLLVHRAWEIRGPGYANQVPAEPMRRFKQMLPAAMEAAQHAAGLAPRDPGPWVVMITTARALNYRGMRFHTLWEGLAQRAPHHYSGHWQALQYWCAKWCGTDKQMMDFAERAVRNAPEGSPLAGIYLHALSELTERHGAVAPVTSARVKGVLTEVDRSLGQARAGTPGNCPACVTCSRTTWARTATTRPRSSSSGSSARGAARNRGPTRPTRSPPSSSPAASPPPGPRTANCRTPGRAPPAGAAPAGDGRSGRRAPARRSGEAVERARLRHALVSAPPRRGPGRRACLTHAAPVGTQQAPASATGAGLRPAPEARLSVRGGPGPYADGSGAPGRPEYAVGPSRIPRDPRRGPAPPAVAAAATSTSSGAACRTRAAASARSPPMTGQSTADGADRPPRRRTRGRPGFRSRDVVPPSRRTRGRPARCHTSGHPAVIPTAPRRPSRPARPPPPRPPRAPEPGGP